MREEHMDQGKENSYRVLLAGGEGEYVEKKSRFIATLQKCEDEEEAVRLVDSMRRRYWDARHNCYAYVIGGRAELTRCSDDGEPSGTAGRPILEVLAGEDIRNVAAVVTRYFGGVLLGTGGLVRAYTQAVKEGLRNCVVGRMRQGYGAETTVDYTDVGKILYLLRDRGIEPLSAEYGEKAVLRLQFPTEILKALQKEMADATSGRARLEDLKEIYFVDKEAT